MPLHEPAWTFEYTIDCADAHTGKASIEFPLPGAIGRFDWTFEETVQGTRITQHCTLEGEKADTFAKTFGPALEGGIPEGMRKLCSAMESCRPDALSTVGTGLRRLHVSDTNRHTNPGILSAIAT
jgi:hypothetical protein